jgi:hypothetical protein
MWIVTMQGGLFDALVFTIPDSQIPVPEIYTLDVIKTPTIIVYGRFAHDATAKTMIMTPV